MICPRCESSNCHVVGADFRVGDDVCHRPMSDGDICCHNCDHVEETSTVMTTAQLAARILTRLNQCNRPTQGAGEITADRVRAANTALAFAISDYVGQMYDNPEIGLADLLGVLSGTTDGVQSAILRSGRNV